MIITLHVALTGSEPMMSAMPAQRSANWTMKALSWEQVNLLAFCVPVVKGLDEMSQFRILTVRLDLALNGG